MTSKNLPPLRRWTSIKTLGSSSILLKERSDRTGDRPLGTLPLFFFSPVLPLSFWYFSWSLKWLWGQVFFSHFISKRYVIIRSVSYVPPRGDEGLTYESQLLLPYLKSPRNSEEISNGLKSYICRRVSKLVYILYMLHL